jgi:hypothetical protein
VCSGTGQLAIFIPATRPCVGRQSIWHGPLIAEGCECDIDAGMGGADYQGANFTRP